MRQATLKANGIEFAYLEEGDGPLVLLLHGFPDNAWTWEHVAPQIAASGYRTVAPFLRGYPPTEVPKDGWFDSGTLATDARALIEALGGGEPASVVGHDWGAAITYFLCAAHPDSVRRAVTLALPHPLVVGAGFLDPKIVHGVFHFWFFQLPDLPEAAVRANGFAFIDYLWKLWSPELDDPEQLARVKETLSEPGALEAAIGYYRAMLNPARQDPVHEQVRAAIRNKIRVPLLNVIGTREIAQGAGEGQESLFESVFRFERIGGGHFLQRERPDEIAKLVLGWLAEP